MENRPKKRVKLGEMLLEQSAISPEQLEQALKEQKRTGRKLGRVLTDLGMLSEDDLHQALARHMQLPYVDLKQMTLDPVVVRQLPETLARRFRALVLQEDKRGLLVGMADPSDLLAYDEFAKRLKQTLRIAVVSESELLRMLDVVYRRTDEIASLVQEVRDDLRESDIDLEQLTADDGSADAPVLRLLQSMFTDAVQVGASDIHIEPGEARLRIRQRIDGVLQEQVLEGSRVAGALVTRLKLMSGSIFRKSACRRTAASRSKSAKRSSTCASRRCPRNTARQWCCACSTRPSACSRSRCSACPRSSSAAFAS
jgi:MSHA biogenesis protein MshE